jgi:hypothetical protein
MDYNCAARIPLAILALAAGCENSPAEKGKTTPTTAASSVQPESPPPSSVSVPANPSRAAENRDEAPGHSSPISSVPDGDPYLAVDLRSNSSIPEALGTGRFLVRDNCIIYNPAGAADFFTPILPAGSQLARSADGTVTALRIRGTLAQLGRAYRISGGEVASTAISDRQLQAPVPARCPSRRFMFGRVMGPS